MYRANYNYKLQSCEIEKLIFINVYFTRIVRFFDFFLNHLKSDYSSNLSKKFINIVRPIMCKI